MLKNACLRALPQSACTLPHIQNEECCGCICMIILFHPSRETCTMMQGAHLIEASTSSCTASPRKSNACLLNVCSGSAWRRPRRSGGFAVTASTTWDTSFAPLVADSRTLGQRNVPETTRPLWMDGRTSNECVEGLRDSALLFRVCRALFHTAV